MKKKEINSLDKLSREIVRDDLKKCVVCGKTNIQVHHIEGRRIRSTRWYFPNLVTLCPSHHTFGLFSAHQSPLSFYRFIIDLWGTDWEKDLLIQEKKVFRGTYQDVEDYLKGITKNYA